MAHRLRYHVFLELSDMQLSDAMPSAYVYSMTAWAAREANWAAVHFLTSESNGQDVRNEDEENVVEMWN